MTRIASFTFNGFQENTHILYDDSGECVVIDPGCSSKEEEQSLTQFIEDENLKHKIISELLFPNHIWGSQNSFYHLACNILPAINEGIKEIGHQLRFCVLISPSDVITYEARNKRKGNYIEEAVTGDYVIKNNVLEIDNRLYLYH